MVDALVSVKRINKQITHLDQSGLNQNRELLREDAPYGDITSGSIISTEKIHAKMISLMT